MAYGSLISHVLIAVIYRAFHVTLTSSCPHWAMASPLITHKRLSQLDCALIQHQCRSPSSCQLVDRWRKGGTGTLSRQEGDWPPKWVAWGCNDQFSDLIVLVKSYVFCAGLFTMLMVVHNRCVLSYHGIIVLDFSQTLYHNTFTRNYAV